MEVGTTSATDASGDSRASGAGQANLELARTSGARKIEVRRHEFIQLFVAKGLSLHATNDHELSSEMLGTRHRTFCVEATLQYHPFRDDFGPMDLGTIHEFITIVDTELAASSTNRIVMMASIERRALTNAVFLLGAYLMLKLDMPPDEVARRFESLGGCLCAFRDVCPGGSTFNLELADVWGGLWRARSLGWLKSFDAAEYKHFASPLNADMHELVPGKIVAMRGPKALGDGELWRDVVDDKGLANRELSPAHVLGALQHFDVRAVVRLNQPEYDKAAFEGAGLGFADLYFEDCTVPPPSVVAKFLRVAEAVPGAVAVHCRSGLGRTGTLAALYMMRNHGFSAREAMGWLRVVRPGSVMGPQQAYLVEREGVMRRAARRAAAASAGEKEEVAGCAVAAVRAAVAAVDELLQAAPRRCRRSPSPAQESSAASTVAHSDGGDSDLDEFQGSDTEGEPPAHRLLSRSSVPVSGAKGASEFFCGKGVLGRCSSVPGPAAQHMEAQPATTSGSHTGGETAAKAAEAGDIVSIGRSCSAPEAGAVEEEVAALRFCADLLPLPTA